MCLIIKTITASQTLPLRQKVLWPGHPIETSMVDGDDTAVHFGGWKAGSLVCVASLFQDSGGIRLRKFATDPAFQGRGYGTQMLEHLLNEASATGAALFWFDARESALPFYESRGFTPEGPHFFKGDIPYRRIRKSLLDDKS